MALVPQNGHVMPVEAAVFTPDSKLLITAGRDAALKFWLAETGELLREVPVAATAQNPVVSLAISRDGKKLAAASARGTVFLWSLEDYTRRGTLRLVRPKDERATPATVAFSSDGQTLLHSCGKTLYWWDLQSEKIKISRTLEMEATTAAVSPDGKWLALGKGSSAQLWSVDSGESQRTWDQPMMGRVQVTLAFSADSKTLLKSFGGALSAWNIEDGSRQTILNRPKPRAGDAPPKTSGIGTHWDLRQKSGPSTIVAPDGIVAARLLKTGELRAWNTQTGEDVSATFSGAAPDTSFNYTDYQELLFAPDGKTVVGINKTGVDDTPGEVGKIRLWNVATGALRWANTACINLATKIVCAPGGKTLACGTMIRNPAAQSRTGYEVWLWDMQTGTPRRVIENAQKISGLALSPDGKTVAIGEGESARFVAVGKANTELAGDRGAAVRWWDIGTGQLRKEVPAHYEAAEDLVFAADGKTLATGGGTLYCGEVALWDVSSGTLKKRWTAHPEGGVLSLARSPDGKLLASGSWDNAVRLWDAQGHLKREFKLLGGYVFDVTFSPDGKYLCTATGGGDNEGWCTLFNVSTGKMLWEREKKSDIFRVAFSPGGASLLLNTGNGAELWNAKLGKFLKALPVGGGFSPDGRLIFGGGVFSKICDARDGKLLASLELLAAGPNNEPQWLVYTPDGFYDGSPGIENHLRWRVGDTLENAAQHIDRRRPGLLAQIWAGKK